MASNIRDILDMLTTVGGLAMGSVLSILSAILLIASEVLALDRTTLALAWVMVGFVFALGLWTVRGEMNRAFEKLGQGV
jgi:hypothetical protein